MKLRRIAGIALIAILGAGAIVGGYWFFEIRPRMMRLEGSGADFPPGKSQSIAARTSPHADFDLEIPLAGSPLGGASNGSEIVVANRQDPWGAIRIREEAEEFIAQQVPVTERTYRQRMALNGIAWNGRNYVGLASASWFESQSDMFVILNPETLQMVGMRAAPPLLGCLAFDGTSYWAATRRNTRDAAEEAFLYKLDRDFQVVAKYEPPAVGCQGMTWDGKRLWFADVFADQLFILDTSGDAPVVVNSAELPVSYLSGVVLHRGRIWIADYDENRLRRMRQRRRMALSNVPGEAPAPALASAAAGFPAPGDPSLETLQGDLRSGDRFKRIEASMTLDRMKAPVPYARHDNSFVQRGAEDAEALEWSVEIRDGAVWIDSGRLWFGAELFSGRTASSSIVTVPLLARYEFTVKGPGGSKVERSFSVTSSGEIVLSRERLADATLPGEYQVSLFIHVQYVDPEGVSRILNNSEGFVTLRQ